MHSETVTVSNTAGSSNTVTTTYQHTNDLVSSGSTAIYQLLGANMYNTVISTSVTRNGNPVSKVTNNYYSPSAGVFVPQSTDIQVGANAAETRQLYTFYDRYGHLLEKQAPNGVREDYLWGYNSLYPVAKVVGSDRDHIAATVDQRVLDNASDDVAMRNELNKLREIRGTLVTTYTYDKAYGLTSETDPRGNIVYYVYDVFGRLSHIADRDKNILKKFSYAYDGQEANNHTPGIGNDPQWATFTNNTANCGAGTTPGTYTYAVPANTYTSYIDKADANQMAIADMNVSGQAMANTLPCLASLNSLNLTNQPWNVVFTNAATNASNAYVSYPSSSTYQIANTPPGNYNVSLTPFSPGSVTSPVELIWAGTHYTGTSFSFPNYGFTTATSFTLQNSATAPCSFAMAPGFSSPTNSIAGNGTTVTFYMVFYSASAMADNTSYLVATVNGGCRPSATRTIHTTISNRNWTITINTDGKMYWKSDSGSTVVPPNTTISSSNLSYNL